MQFDLNKLMEDPNFISGVGLLGGSSPQTQPLLQAYQMLRQHQQSKQAGAFKQQEAERDRLDSESQREYRRAQMEVARANSEKLGEQTAVSRAKLEQGQKNREMLERIMGGGGQMPGMQQQQMVAPPPEPVGKYGTPKVILDNLKKVESNGNPFAIGPDIGGGVRAKGAFQFLPSTVDMLGRQGMKFDPFNPQQAEDAADFYLQSLVKQNGGDMQKALAAYGGFKTKDASSYISRVMSGSPESVVKQRAQSQAATQVQQRNGQVFGVDSVKMGADGDLDFTIKPNHEQQRIDIQREELKLKEDEYSLKQRESQRQDVELGMRERTTSVTEAAERRQAGDAQRVTEQRAFERKTATAQDHKQVSMATTNLGMLSQKINELDKHPGLDRIFGLVGQFPDVPGAPAADARAKHTSIVKQLAKESLQAIRDASKTGGALGNVSDKDIELLETAIQSLGKAQSTESARQAMKDVQKYSARIQNISIESFERTHGSSPLANLPPGARVAGTDPKTGKTFYRLPDGKFVLEK